VDDIATMVTEAIARRVKAAADRQVQVRAQAASLGRSGARPVAPPNRLPPPVPSSPNAAKAPVPMGMPAPPARLAQSASQNVVPPDPLDVLPGLPLTIFDEPDQPRPQLLSSFSGDGLLAGIVLSEALGRPVALREGGSGTLF
jgi:hypothetical protein